MEFKLRALTPIWTGGVKGISDRLYDTGVIGSLRWWYEVLIRGLDGYACDPTSDTGNNCRCPIEERDYKYWCNACELFGMTGLRRRFKIDIDGGSQVYTQKDKTEFINVKPSGRGTGWFLGGGIVDTLDGSTLKEFPITLSIKLLAVEEQEIKDTLEVLLYFVSKWAGIGSRQQHGYGISEVVYPDGSTISIDDTKINNCIGLMRKERPTLRRFEASNALPAFSQFFFAKFRLNNIPLNWRNNIDGKPSDSAQLNRYNKSLSDKPDI